MPELAEVDYYRKQWNAGMGRKIIAVLLHDGKRVFRGVDTKVLKKVLAGATLLSSESRGKQMLFRFSRQGWIGLHLGMSGELRAVPSGAEPFSPGKHDHLVLIQAGRALVFSDPRQFGRVRFEAGRAAPEWWRRLPPDVLSKQFTARVAAAQLARRAGAPIKGALLQQDSFPGIGNWMADEILWRAGTHPRRLAGSLSAEEARRIYRAVKFVSRGAMRTVGQDYRDLPAGWLFGRRWKAGGLCPKDGAPLERATVAGRTTCWCPRCQY